MKPDAGAEYPTPERLGDEDACNGQTDAGGYLSMNVYFWNNIPSHHLAPAFRRLADVWPGEVHWVCHQAALAERKDMGWVPPETGNVKLTVLGGDKTKADEIIRHGCRDVHVISALERDFQTLPHAMKMLCANGCPNLGIIAECGDPRGLRGRLRFLLHSLKARRYRPHAKMVLTMGTSGVEYFTRAGFDKRVVIPYLYQLEDASGRADVLEPEIVDSGQLGFVYVGRLIALKGVDLLLKALGAIRKGNWSLTMVGVGPEERRLRFLASRIGIDDKIQWLGPVPSGQVRSLLARHDVCMCPSRYDGWCMVVSEAIDSGIGVITTEAVGARDAVRASGAGQVIRPHNARVLQAAIEGVIADPGLVRQWKERARRYRHCLAGRAVGDYLAKVLEHVFLGNGPRPREPWIGGVNVEGDGA